MASHTICGGLGFGLGRALARLGVAEGGFLAALGGEHHRLLLAFGLEDGGLAQAFGLEDLRALLALGLHLPAPWSRRGRAAGAMSLISMRVTLTPQGSVACVDDVQQPRVDLVALGQQLVEVHRAHHGADVGHGQVDDGVLELVAPRRRPWRRSAPGRRRRRRPSTMALSRVMTSCDGMSSTCSIMFILAPTRSMNGMMSAGPGCSVRV